MTRGIRGFAIATGPARFTGPSEWAVDEGPVRAASLYTRPRPVLALRLRPLGTR
jgi:hypothetical protein